MTKREIAQMIAESRKNAPGIKYIGITVEQGTERLMKMTQKELETVAKRAGLI